MKRLLIILLLSLSSALSADYEQPSDYEDDEYDLPYVKIQYASDFSQLGKTARIGNKIILLEFSASYCEYCDLLEEEFLKPMLRNADITAKVIIRKLDMDSYYNIKGFTGNKTTPTEIAQNFKVPLSPTLLFLDGYGNEVATRIIGINSLELYGGYIDDAIKSGLHRIRSR